MIVTSKIALVAAGLVAGGVLATTVAASASSSSPAKGHAHHGFGDRAGRFGHGLEGTVTAVGSSSVTIKTSSATTTYAVTSASHLQTKLADIKVGDTVHFTTLPSSATTIAFLVDSKPTFSPLGDLTSGTVMAVGASSVTIKSAAGTTTYAVTSTSKIVKVATGSLAGVASGDAVAYSATGSTLTLLIDGKLGSLGFGDHLGGHVDGHFGAHRGSVGHVQRG